MTEIALHTLNRIIVDYFILCKIYYNDEKFEEFLISDWRENLYFIVCKSGVYCGFLTTHPIVLYDTSCGFLTNGAMMFMKSVHYTVIVDSGRSV